MTREHESDSMFEAALRALDLPVIVHGLRDILFANESACRAVRAAHSSDLIGADITSLVHPDALHAGEERRRLVIERGQTIRDLPVKLQALDGATLYARVDAKRIEWNGETAILLVATSVKSE